jgi:SET domain-containing protein
MGRAARAGRWRNGGPAEADNPGMARLAPRPTGPASDAPASAPPAARGVPADPQKFAVEVRASRIDGRGAFAGEAIPARRKIGEIRGESISVREARRRAKALALAGTPIMIVEVSETRAIDAARSTDPLRYTNHCCAPNTTLRVRQGRIEFYARRDIAAGDELTAHYGESHHEGRLTCRCGAPSCAGRL